jgi:signal recognition particle subunit SRP54
MVLEKLGSSLRDTMRKIARAGYIDKETLDAAVKDLQRALLASDVNVKLVFEISEKIKKRSAEEKPKAGLSKREHVVNIIYEEISGILAGKEEHLELKEKTRIMLVGLFGSGKTTTCAKLAKYLVKRGLKVKLISTDTWRPAAFEQLKQLGAEINVPVHGGGKNPVKILKEGLKDAKDYDVVIVDSAGRDALDAELAKELKQINKVLDANEKLLVMPADLGQKASEQANGFNELVGIDGVILTKLESSAKGGGALSACAALGVPIKFVGIGEKVDDFEEFNPTKFVSKLLGMGDLESLIKKTQEIFAEAPQDEVKAMMKGQFNLKDLYSQIQGMRKMGPLKKVMEMLPMGVDLPQDKLQMSEERISAFTTIMDSMTKDELENPDKIDKSRMERVAKGSGMKVEDVRALMKQYNMTKKMMKRFGKNKRSMQQLMKQFKGVPGL